MKILTFVLAVLTVGLTALGLISCGGYGNGGYLPPSKLLHRVLASQGVTATFSFGALRIINAEKDILPPVGPISAGSSPGLMAISPTLAVVAAYDANSTSVFGINAVTETSLGTVRLPGPTTSMVVPTAAPIAYAAVPTAIVNGFSFTGAVEAMNFNTGSITTTIAVTNAQTVVSNATVSNSTISSATGAQLLVFSNDSDAVTVLNPVNAVPPVDMSCMTTPTNASVCAIVPGFDRPVNAIFDSTGTTAYIFNCGAECGGVQASVAIFDMATLTITNTIPVNGATVGFLSGTSLYVAGNGTASGQPCKSLPSAGKTAAAFCGTLDIVDLSTMTDPYLNSPATEIAIPDGRHDRIDMSVNGQLFVGSRDCQNIGNQNIPDGEVRGCLAIYNTTNNSVVIPPVNGNVDGLQSFTQRDIEYVAEGGVLLVYDTTKDVLLINDDVPQGRIDIVGYVGDVKAIDFY